MYHVKIILKTTAICVISYLFNKSAYSLSYIYRFKRNNHYSEFPYHLLNPLLYGTFYHRSCYIRVGGAKGEMYAGRRPAGSFSAICHLVRHTVSIKRILISMFLWTNELKWLHILFLECTTYSKTLWYQKRMSENV